MLSILLLTYNDVRYLEGCLASIQKHVADPFEVILIDNGSSEKIPDSLRERFAWLKVIQSEKNLGFNAGNNFAARHASGEYLLILNIDTQLLTPIDPAIRLLQTDPRIGAVGAEARHADGKPRPSAGHFPKAHRLWLFKSLWVKPKVVWGPSELQTFKVDWVEGSFLLTRAEDWNAIGGFDEKHFLFGNDVNFCRSVSQRGQVAVQCAAVKYVHFGGYGSGRMGHLYAGFRDYHKNFSTPTERRTADLVLRVGLIFRILVYGLWYFATRNKRVGEKYERFNEVRKNWAQLTP
jgi:N-acetylglucosaminyl-diphospho-decaprenol L-rhamnosyltransferase